MGDLPHWPTFAAPLTALADSGADPKAASQLDRAVTDRLTLAAVAVNDPESHQNGLARSLRDSALHQGQQTAILVRTWEAAVEGRPGGRTPHPR